MFASSIVRRYALIGTLFGFAFPATAILIDAYVLRDAPTGLIDLFRSNPLHFIIALAPFILGAVFAMLGRAQSRRLALLAEKQSAQDGFRFFVHGVRDYAIYMVDAEGCVLNWNAGAKRTKGYSADEIIGQSFARFYTPEDRASGMPARNLRQALTEGLCRTEGWRVRKDGSRFWASVIIEPVRDEDENLIGFAKITRDRTEQMETERKLKHSAWHDSLTLLPNRSHFLDRLDSALSLTVYGGGSVAVACIDLNGFKEINDTLGHAVGDEILAAFAERLSNAMEDGETAGRFGGDEFIAMKRYSDDAELADFIGRLEEAASTVLELSERSLRVSGSIGFATFPSDAEDRDMLINNADLAMYRAKASNSDMSCRYESAMDEAARARRALANDIPRAMHDGEFFLHYQRQCSVASGAVTGYEVLLRWNHPEKGAISPGEFIPVAEDYGLVGALGDWVLETACREARERGIEGRIAVNLSAVQLADPNFTERLKAILVRTGMSPAQLELEVTETAIISDKTRALHTLRQIRALGITLAIDDFGTGYSSLDTLQSFPFDKIKLDRTFVSGLASSDRARAIVRAVLALGRSFSIPVLAEGIETEQQLDILRLEGCEEAQGFLLGRPAPWDEARLDLEGRARRGEAASAQTA